MKRLPPSAFVLLVVEPFVAGLLAYWILRDMYFFYPDKNILLSLLAATIVIVFSVVDVWRSLALSRAEATVRLAKQALLYLLVPVAIVAMYVLCYVVEISPAWPAIPAAIVAFLVARRFLRPTDDIGFRHVERGQELLSAGDVERALSNAFADSSDPDRLQIPDDALYWGNMPIPADSDLHHFCVVGTSGSGKTITIRLLMQQVLPHVARRPGWRALVYDAKGDGLSLLAGMGTTAPVVLLNPFDRRSAAWDIAADVTQLDAALEVAKIFIPDRQHESQPYFPEAARELVANLMFALHHTCPGAWTLRDVILATDSAKTLREIISRDRRTAHVVEKHFGAREFRSVFSTLGTKLGELRPVAALWQHALAANRKINLREWAKGEYILVLGKSHTSQAALDAINRVIVQRLTEILLDADESVMRRTWFFLDELRGGGALTGFAKLLNEGRSKGVRVVIGFQSIAGFEIAFGEKEAHEILSQVHNMAILRLGVDAKTAEWASKVIGDQEIREGFKTRTWSQQGWSHSVSEQLNKRETVLPSEFQNLPPPSQAAGLVGYYVTPFVPPYRGYYSGDQLFTKLLRPPMPGIDNVQRRPPEQQELEPWDDSDRKRLKLLVAETANVSSSSLRGFPAVGNEKKQSSRQPNDENGKARR